MSTNEPDEEIVIAIRVEKPDANDDQKYRVEPTGQQVPPTVSPAFRDFLVKHFGYDPVQQGGAELEE